MCDLAEYINKILILHEKHLRKEYRALKIKKFYFRVDLNVPMKNGSITESSRIEKNNTNNKLIIRKASKNNNFISYW